MAEEIFNVTWGLDGEQLDPWQAAQRLYLAGFKDARVLAKMWAVLESESGGYLRAWHHNVKRDAEGNIVYEADKFIVFSTDLGFIQKNVKHNEPVKLEPGESQGFVNTLFELNPELARGDRSAEIAWRLYQDRGFDPWVAERNGSYRRNMDRGCLAVANYLAKSYGLGENLFKRR